MPPIRAFIFDLDGVVVDSNEMHVQSWQEVARRHGFPCDDPDYIGKCGLRTLAVIQDLLRWPVSSAEAERIGWEKEELYRQWIREGGIRPIRGVMEFLTAAYAAGIPCAIGSSAPRENVNVCVSALRLEQIFSVTVSGADVQRGKPAPDIFLKAAAGLNIPPEQCLVFEDAPAGVEAAHAASMRVVALRTSHAANELAAADAVIADFTELPPPEELLLGAWSRR